jgi:Diguanylate cyclase, GGDEF domain/Y_Y_Y domain
MPLHRPHLRRFALLCLLCPSHYSFAVKPPPLQQQPQALHDAGNVTCRYRLEGLQTKFTKADSPEIHYSSLPPGNYTFQVVCDSPQLAQSISGANTFTVTGPWWQSLWWQRWLTEIAGSCGVVLLLVGILWKRHSDRRKSEHLERAVAERSAALALANHELQEASIRDPLTGVRNRRFFQSMIGADASQAVRAYRGSEIYSRDHRDLIFFLIDIDHFKSVNDEYGHDA